jgi:2-dehydro-3-deoxyphosphogalactonate aldolase
MACWDILGKDVGRPVYRLLGGMFRDRVRTYTYIYADPADERWTREQLWLHPEPTAERARYYADLGFNGVKLDPFGAGVAFDQGLGQVIPVEYSLRAMDTAEATIRAVREAVGDRCDILVGTHGQMTAAGAIRVAKRLEPYDPLWFEEPVPPENMAEMARVAHATSIPITTGERLTTKYDFARLIAHQAAAIFNLDVGQVGGILETKKIAALAEAAYLQISPHVYGGPLIAAASVQVATCCPNFLIMESIERCDGFYAELIDPPLEWRDSYLLPSERPGLGHDLNEEVATRHAPGR